LSDDLEVLMRVPSLSDRWRPSRGGDGQRLSRSALVAVVVATASIGLAGLAWYERDQADRRDDTITACLAAATPASQAIFSYDYRTFDAGVATARSFITGAFVNDYATTTASLKATAVQAQAVVQAEVSAVGVVDASPDGVDVLVYLNQYRRNVNITGEKIDQNRVVLTMVRTSDGCKVSTASAI
jgi:Mce-associated membrane protein